MEAQFLRLAVFLTAFFSLGASYRTANFIVEAPTSELAERIGKEAERYRRDLAIEWLGKPMPNWYRPCPIVADVAPRKPAGGQTSFVFDRGEVFGWDMHIQGSEERVLDSVLPHEVTHTIFASHFRRGLPRWADEGACTTVEHASERQKQQQMLIQFLRTNQGIPFDKMFAMKDYPPNVLPLYAQGYSLARYLISQGGKRKFIEFVGEGMKNENWSAVTKKYYGFSNLATLQNEWLAWVKQGSPPLNYDRNPEMLASHERPAADDVIYRAQNADRDDSEKLVRFEDDRSAAGQDTAQFEAEHPRQDDWAADNTDRLAARRNDAPANPSPANRGSRPSVYSRQPASPPLLPSSGSSDSASLPAREAPQVAQRDNWTPSQRQVLLEWQRSDTTLR